MSYESCFCKSKNIGLQTLRWGKNYFWHDDWSNEKSSRTSLTAASAAVRWIWVDNLQHIFVPDLD